jgi:dienelactone hydrolase
VYRDAGGEALVLDLWYPPHQESETGLPALVFVLGYPDAGMRKVLGCSTREMGQYTSWARLAAASGMAAVTYATQEPPSDVHAVLQHLRENAVPLGLDASRIGLWSCSGNVPTALSALLREAPGAVRCAVLCYGMMLDWEGSTLVADAARTWGFAAPAVGLSVTDLPRETPLFIARAGADELPHLNASIDHFVAEALALDLPVTLHNHRGAPHAFDAILDDDATREVIARMLAFLRFHLAA